MQEPQKENNQITNQEINENEIHMNFEDRKYFDPTRSKFSPIPKRIIMLCIFLMITGSSFLIAGMVDYWEGDQERGIAFIVLGSFLSIPGYFYGYQLYLAATAQSPEERQEILDEIPNYQ